MTTRNPLIVDGLHVYHFDTYNWCIEDPARPDDRRFYPNLYYCLEALTHYKLNRLSAKTLEDLLKQIRSLEPWLKEIAGSLEPVLPSPNFPSSPE